MSQEFERDNGTRGVQDKQGKIIANLPAKGGIPIPSAATTNLSPSSLGSVAQTVSDDTNYKALHQKMTETAVANIEELAGTFGAQHDEIQGQIQTLTETFEEAKANLEDKENDLWIEFRDYATAILDTHRPIYNLGELTLSNRGEWDKHRECATCHVAYPCKPYHTTKNALDKYSPYNAYDGFAGQHGRKVTRLLEDEADKKAIDSLPQTLSNGMVRGTVLSDVEAAELPAGSIVKMARDRQIWVKISDSGWASVSEAPGWYKMAEEYLKEKKWNTSPHPFSRSNTEPITLEGFIPN